MPYQVLTKATVYSGKSSQYPLIDFRWNIALQKHVAQPNFSSLYRSVDCFIGENDLQNGF